MLRVRFPNNEAVEEGIGIREIYVNPLREAAEHARRDLSLLFERFEKMPNANYIAGRRMEYDRKAHYEDLGMEVTRSSGSHGSWDLIAIDWSRGITTCIQCKLVGDLATARRLLDRFRANPPHLPQPNLYQRLEVKVKGSTEIHSVTI